MSNEEGKVPPTAAAVVVIAVAPVSGAAVDEELFPIEPFCAAVKLKTELFVYPTPPFPAAAARAAISSSFFFFSSSFFFFNLASRLYYFSSSSFFFRSYSSFLSFISSRFFFSMILRVFSNPSKLSKDIFCLSNVLI